MKDYTGRFSSKAGDYERYRPSYPKALPAYFAGDFGMNKNSIVADIGSGTGIFTELLLDRIQTVYAVEPNTEMRTVAEKRLKDHPNFVSVNGRAEATGLAENSLDFITAAQAFHWFDPEKTKPEFARILKKDAFVFLVWNTRSSETEFMQAYEALLHSDIKEFKEKTYPHLHKGNIESLLNTDFRKKSFPNGQLLDWQGLIGRFNSSSYVPPRDSMEYKPLENKLRGIFSRFEENGRILFSYETIVYSGRIRI